VPLEKFKVLMDAQDRQSHTKRHAREDQRSAATIAPLVGLKVARSGTLPLQRPFGLTGVSPSPGLLSLSTWRGAPCR
jgi:hypothetical protein